MNHTFSTLYFESAELTNTANPSMSLAIAFKGPEGIVLAADSRVTLTTSTAKGVIHATYDNATKLFAVGGQPY